MRSWPIRRKLLLIPVLAVVLVTVTMLCLLAAGRRYEHDVRAAVDATLDTHTVLISKDGVARYASRDALDRAANTFATDRAGLGSCLTAALAGLLVAAWRNANGFARRVQTLRDNLEPLFERKAVAAPDDPANADTHRGDEIQRLSDRLHKALFRGRERETRMRRSSEFLEFAQAAGGFGVFDMDLVTGRVTGTALFFELLEIANRNALFTRDEWLAGVHPEDFEYVIEQLNAAITTGGRFQAEYRSLLRDGGLRWLALRGEILRDAEGFPARAIGTLTDITERKQLEDTLRDTTESLNLAQAVASVATKDLDFGRKRWIASDNFRDILGIPAATPLDDLDGHLAAVHPEDLERIRRAPFDTTRDAPSYTCEYRVVLPDASLRWITETASVSHDADGKPARIIGALVDVTPVKRTEQVALDARRAAESANLAKSSFLANVSHEIRTPMNGVIGMAQILAETSLDENQREYVDVIRGSAHALLLLINDVLDLSKIEAGRLDLETVSFDLHDVIYETVAVLALQSAVKGIELIVSIADISLITRGDPGRLRQIVLNLVGNAIKFTHEGYILLSASAVTGPDGLPKLKIEVTDTGIGIPNDRLDRLFKSFSQIDSTTTRHYGGSGLGLSIVKRLAELMNGEVGVTSTVGQGSTFWVTLAFDAVEQQPRYSPQGQGKRILVVDDLAPGRNSLALKLAFFSYETVTVPSVDAALEHLDGDAHIDLVLADELMPGRGGLDLLTALRADPRHARLPLVLLSLFGTEHNMDSWPHRPDAIGSKPIRGSRLATLINGVLNGEPPQIAPAAPQTQRLLPAFPGRRVLLVEDNPVNQRVAQHVLKKLGVEVITANNGADALERIDTLHFDAILMDCQMPVMDGFTATRRIRETERLAGWKQRRPIIALTANVMSEDRENCIAAGMDAHLTKPLEPAQLAGCLARYFTEEIMSNEIDFEALRELTGGDAEFERELVDTFIASGDQCLAEIVVALRASDYDTIGRRAHSLKGASANMHAHPLCAAAAHLENAARSNAVAEIDGLVQKLGERFRAVNAQLAKVS